MFRLFSAARAERILEEHAAGIAACETDYGVRPVVKVKLSDLTEISDKKQTAKKTSAGSYSAAKVSTISPEINLIGNTVDDAISLLDKYIDDALMSRLDKIRVVHGKGIGALRKGIHDYLRSHPGVKRFDLAAHGEGDGGVTIVEL